MSNSGLIAAMGSVAAAMFFLAAVLAMNLPGPAGRAMTYAALLLAGVYLFVSLFWGVRATSLESFSLTKKKE